MGLVGSVGSALKCFDALAWPILALGYPTYASVLAIEANLSAEALKLVTYWVLFSLISLVEHALGTLLFWIPLWPYIKLAFVAWLMIPHFDGAFYVYEHLVRPCFSITSPVIIDGLNKRKELSPKGGDLLVEEEKYLHQNGPQALEKLLSSQSMCKNPMAAPKSIVAVKESSYNDSTVAELKDCNEMITAEAKVDNENYQLPILPTPPSVFIRRHSFILGRNEVHNENHLLPILPTPPSFQALGQVPLQESQREWTCALCQVTTKAENALKSHLQGKKHKAALEALKAKKRPLLFNDSRKAVLEALKAKKHLWCSICDVTCYGSCNFVQHCNGRKHMARIQELAGLNNGCKEAGGTGICWVLP